MADVHSILASKSAVILNKAGERLRYRHGQGSMVSCRGVVQVLPHTTEGDQEHKQVRGTLRVFKSDVPQAAEGDTVMLSERYEDVCFQVDSIVEDNPAFWVLDLLYSIRGAWAPGRRSVSAGQPVNGGRQL